jgi:hypothetical protein
VCTIYNTFYNTIYNALVHEVKDTNPPATVLIKGMKCAPFTTRFTTHLCIYIYVERERERQRERDRERHTERENERERPSAINGMDFIRLL